MNNILDHLFCFGDIVIHFQETLKGYFHEAIVFLYVLMMVGLVVELVYPLVYREMKSY